MNPKTWQLYFLFPIQDQDMAYSFSNHIEPRTDESSFNSNNDVLENE